MFIEVEISDVIPKNKIKVTVKKSQIVLVREPSDHEFKVLGINSVIQTTTGSELHVLNKTYND